MHRLEQRRGEGIMKCRSQVGGIQRPAGAASGPPRRHRALLADRNLFNPVSPRHSIGPRGSRSGLSSTAAWPPWWWRIGRGRDLFLRSSWIPASHPSFHGTVRRGISPSVARRLVGRSSRGQDDPPIPEGTPAGHLRVPGAPVRRGPATSTSWHWPWGSDRTGPRFSAG
jgi:hypothetical protein